MYTEDHSRNWDIKHAWFINHETPRKGMLNRALALSCLERGSSFLSGILREE